MIHAGQKILLPDGSTVFVTEVCYDIAFSVDRKIRIDGLMYDECSRQESKGQEHGEKSKAPIKSERVIYNGPATIVYWTDGTKTVVKRDHRDKYSKRMGLFLCHLKKLCGNNSRAFNDMFKRMQEIIENKEYEGENA